MLNVYKPKNMISKRNLPIALLILGAGSLLLQKLGIAESLPSGEPDPGLLVPRAGRDGVSAFISALAKHRHVERDRDPPAI